MKTISEITLLAQECGAVLKLGMPSKVVFTEGDLMTFVRAIAKEAREEQKNVVIQLMSNTYGQESD